INHKATSVTINQAQKRPVFFSANGSLNGRIALGGTLAMQVNAVPNGILIFMRPFTAQPQASRIGPTLRWRSFRKASNAEGPEIATKTPRMASGICQALRLQKPVAMLARAAPSVPTAKPMAAKMPANLAASNCSSFLGGAPGAGAGGGAPAS